MPTARGPKVLELGVIVIGEGFAPHAVLLVIFITAEVLGAASERAFFNKGSTLAA